MARRVYTYNDDTKLNETQIWGVVGMEQDAVDRLEVHAAKANQSLSKFLGPLMLLAALTFLEENPLPDELQRRQIEEKKLAEKALGQVGPISEAINALAVKKRNAKVTVVGDKPAERKEASAKSRASKSIDIDQALDEQQRRQQDNALSLSALCGQAAGRQPARPKGRCMCHNKYFYQCPGQKSLVA